MLTFLIKVSYRPKGDIFLFLSRNLLGNTGLARHLCLTQAAGIGFKTIKGLYMLR